MLVHVGRNLSVSPGGHAAWLLWRTVRRGRGAGALRALQAIVPTSASLQPNHFITIIWHSREPRASGASCIAPELVGKPVLY